ncbi:hypothetical protein GCM10027047_16770 [Rhodococcus aerolatus]
MTVPPLPPPSPSRARAPRGSYLDQLLAGPCHTTPAPEVPAAAEPDPRWASWWDDAWPVEPTPTAAPAAERIAPVLPPVPADRPEPVDDGPEPRPARRPRLPIPALTRTAPAVPRRTVHTPAVQRSRLPGRGVHVTRRGPAWSAASAGQS